MVSAGAVVQWCQLVPRRRYNGVAGAVSPGAATIVTGGTMSHLQFDDPESGHVSQNPISPDSFSHACD